MGLYEIRHQFYTRRIIQANNIYTAVRQEIYIAGKISVLTYHYSRYIELNNSTGTHHTWAQSRIEDSIRVSRLPPRACDAFHLAMQDGITLLDTLIMAPPNDLAISHKN